MRKKLNRIVLALVGLALVVLGALTLIGALDLQRHWGFSLPSGWPLDRPHQPPLSDAGRTRWRSEDWWWPVVFAFLGLVTLFLLWWLLTLLRDRRVGYLYVDSGDDETAELRGSALERVMETETEELDGVDRARVTLHGRRSHPRARIALTLASHASPTAIVAHLGSEELRDARESVGLESLPAEVRLRSDRHPASKVE
jgi:hypothetical protein